MTIFNCQLIEVHEDNSISLMDCCSIDADNYNTASEAALRHWGGCTGSNEYVRVSERGTDNWQRT